MFSIFLVDKMHNGNEKFLIFKSLAKGFHNLSHLFSL